MSERLSLKNKILSAAGAMLIVASCTNKDETIKMPNVEAPVVQNDAEGRSRPYLFAYGMGLSVGCNSDILLGDDNLPKPSTPTAEAYEQALQNDPKATHEGFRAGLQRGLAESAIEDSVVC